SAAAPHATTRTTTAEATAFFMTISSMQSDAGASRFLGEEITEARSPARPTRGSFVPENQNGPKGPGWWLVAGGWWLVVGGRWLVARGCGLKHAVPGGLRDGGCARR